MRVVQFSTSLSRSAGGLYYSVSGLSKALSALGAEVVVVGGADKHFEADRSIWGDVELRPYPLGSGTYGLATDIPALIATLKPDLLHIQGIWTAASVYGRLATMRKVPTVVSPRGMLDPWILARSRMVKAVHAAVFERPMLRRAHPHALNEAERQSIAAFVPQAAERTFVIPNGVETVEPLPQAAPRAGFLYLGRLHSKKQVAELVRAWATSPAASRENLTIAGWGDGAYETELRALVSATPNVEFVGSLYGEAKSTALRSARFFILPSVSEGLPMAVLEAVQYGVIPIITDECNLPELFAENIALRMSTNFTDFDTIIAAATSMSETEITRRLDAAQAFGRRYLWDTIAREMLEKYREILDRDGSHG